MLTMAALHVWNAIFPEPQAVPIHEFLCHMGLVTSVKGETLYLRYKVP